MQKLCHGYGQRCYLDKVLLVYFFFFFSSRRRHTRCSRDWSSDVCSSDLEEQHAEGALRAARAVQFGFQHADETAIIREARKGIADGHAAYLLEQARLVKQSAGEHHHVAERLAQLREEERPVEELARKGRGDVADRIQRG